MSDTCSNFTSQGKMFFCGPVHFFTDEKETKVCVNNLLSRPFGRFQGFSSLFHLEQQYICCAASITVSLCACDDE